MLGRNLPPNLGETQAFGVGEAERGVDVSTVHPAGRPSGDGPWGVAMLGTNVGPGPPTPAALASPGGSLAKQNCSTPDPLSRDLGVGKQGGGRNLCFSKPLGDSGAGSLRRLVWNGL